MTAKEKRALVISKAKPALGRNRYSQDPRKRECVFTPHTDGRYYSDCSSFVRWLYRLLSIALAISDYLNIGGNTEGILLNKKGVEIDCKIKNGVPTDMSALRVGDVFLFRGNNTARSRYVGHVEIVSEIKGNSVTLMGHGSGNPKTHGMVGYCRLRWLWKMPGVIRNRGLICVKRFIPDDPIAPGQPVNLLRVTGKSVNVRLAPGLFEKIIDKVYDGAILTRSFVDTDKWYGIIYKDRSVYISRKYTEEVR